MRTFCLVWVAVSSIALFSENVLSEIYKCEINGKIELTDDKKSCEKPQEIVIEPANIVHSGHARPSILFDVPEEKADLKMLKEIEGFRYFFVEGKVDTESFFKVENDGKAIYLLSKDRVVKLNKIVGSQNNLYVREPTSGIYFSDLSPINNGIYAIKRRSLGRGAKTSGVGFFNSKGEISSAYEERPQKILYESGSLWIGGSDYVGWIDPESKQVYMHNSGYVWEIEDGGEYIWFGVRDEYDKDVRAWKKIGGVYYADKNTKEFSRLGDSLLISSDIFGLHVEGKYLWVSHGSLGSGLTRYNLEVKESDFLSFSTNGIGLGGYNFASDEKYIWMSDYGNLVRLDKKTLVAEEFSCHTPKKCRILDMMHDGERLWLALGENGVVTIH